MLNWFEFGLLSILAITMLELLQKIAMTRAENVSAIANNFFVWTLQGLLGLFVAYLVGFPDLVWNFDLIIKLALIGSIYFAGGSLFYTSYKSNSSSISLILASVSVVVSSFLGVVFLHDFWNFNKVIGILLIISAILFLNYEKRAKLDKYNLAALGGGVCFGVAYTIDKALVLNISPFVYGGMMPISVGIMSLVFAGKHIVNEMPKFKWQNYLLTLGGAFSGVAFNLATHFSYRAGGSVGVLDAMNNSSIFILILLEIFILKDKSHLKRKIISAVLAFTGIVFFAI